MWNYKENKANKIHKNTTGRYLHRNLLAEESSLIELSFPNVEFYIHNKKDNFAEIRFENKNKIFKSENLFEIWIYRRFDRFSKSKNKRILKNTKSNLKRIYKDYKKFKKGLK